jgi:isopentenyl diphosphate isomerase/L-lactate dehydrogenase-like FMN-dependent dehydrogenase
MGYLNRGREDVLECAKMAEELGYAAVGLTMDTVQPVKIGDHVPLSTKDGKPRRGHPASPRNIEWLKREVSLPVVVKGIMSGEDARVAVEAGADLLVVSNHGGRILDFNRAAIEALPEVVQAVKGRVPVLLDSGIRSGGDIVKALALGAKAVLVGRPIGWGVGAAGAEGVARVIEILTEEMKRVMILTGIGAIGEITESILIREE